MDHVLAVARALGDPNRLRVLHALRGRELCACRIVDLLGLAQATVSRHMSVLVAAGLVVGRKEGRWVHYRLPGDGDDASAAVREALEWALRHGADDPRVREDGARLCDCGAGLQSSARAS